MGNRAAEHPTVPCFSILCTAGSTGADGRWWGMVLIGLQNTNKVLFQVKIKTVTIIMWL
jgi:hypothetical protein